MVLLEILGIAVLFLFIYKIYRILTRKFYKSIACMKGKTVIVIGGTNDIGFETAKHLAELEARVIITCRNIGSGLAAREKIIELTGNENVVYRHLDLSKFRSIRKFCDRIYRTEERLDVLINNAEYRNLGNRLTEDGNHIGMQVNYFGPFLLTNLLLPLLKLGAPSRIVNVSSRLHMNAQSDFGNLNMKKYWSDDLVYVNSKSYIDLMTIELARRLKGTGVTVNAVQPEVEATNKFSSDESVVIEYLLEIIWNFFHPTVFEASQTVIYLSVAPEVSRLSGRYFYNCKEKLTLVVSRDEELARILWNETEKIIKNSAK